MSRRSHSVSPSPRPPKRARVGGLTPDDYRDGVMLAPMVRSGALGQRVGLAITIGRAMEEAGTSSDLLWVHLRLSFNILFALKNGAKLVWGPEIVDKAILHATREVDPVTGIISYNGVSRAMFTTHPIEKPHLIYQIGTADPDLAVQAAKVVMNDISGIDLNCGCPKPFSTHSGMGAALLSTPDLLCSILTALRAALPSEICVSAKIRLLPTQEDTLKLVEQIVNTGAVSALTVHCRTRNMRPRERALLERMRGVVDFVKGMGKDVAILQNGDCQDFNDALRYRKMSGAESVMIATAAESNPTCFSPEPLTDLETTFIPQYIRIAKYLDNHWASTKFCTTQFKGVNSTLSKSKRADIKSALARSKNYEDVEAEGLIGSNGWTGEREFWELVKSIEERRVSVLVGEADPVEEEMAMTEEGKAVETPRKPLVENVVYLTPPDRRSNPEPVGTGAPLLPSNERMMPVPAMVEAMSQNVVSPVA